MHDRESHGKIPWQNLRSYVYRMEHLSAIIVYSYSSAPMECARHGENINMHGTARVVIQKAHSLAHSLLSVGSTDVCVRSHTQPKYIRSPDVITHAFTRSRLPLLTVHFPHSVTTRREQSPLDAPPTWCYPHRRVPSPTDPSSPSSCSLSVVSSSLFRTFLTYHEHNVFRSSSMKPMGLARRWKKKA